MSESGTPERPTPPVTPPKAPPPRAQQGRKPGMVWIAGGAGLLLLLAVGLFWGLPRYLASQDADAPPRNEAVEVPSTPVVSGEVAPNEIERQRAKRQAEAALERILRAQARLIEADVELWAPDEFDAALETLARGDSLFETEAYAQALEAYEEVEAAFEALEDSRPERFAEALRRGAEALSANDVETAIAQYRIATALDPDSSDAARGLERAEKREEVLANMETGRTRREQGELSAALEAFKAAARIDSAYEPARQAVREVEAAIAERRFSQAMSDAFDALERGDFAAAEQALARARSIRPDADALALAMQRLETERQQAQLTELRERAARQVEAEAWAEAVETYRAALEIDSNVAFAVQGLPRAHRRAELDAAFRRYLEDPTRLYSQQPLAQAEQLLENAATIEEPGTRLQAQMRELRELVAAAKTPVEVTFRSDGETTVTVFKVGELGNFQERTLTLRPGSYVAVGTRRGYRDVRQEFTVRPGEPPDPVVVICKELV